jgi:uncharacterized LabA/DUF88 family protein
LSQQERVNIAVFIDFDNIEIGVKNTLGQHFDIGIILEALKERGEIVSKIAYADWTRASDYSRHLTQHAVRLVQRNLTPGGDKNGADINMALDALEMAFTHQHINAYVIVGGDSDFLSLVEKLKQYDKKVFIVVGRAFTSAILQKNCHEFIAYENLVRKPVSRSGRAQPPAPQGSRDQAARLMETSPISQAFPIVRRALKILADREVTPQTGLLKSTLLQLDSTFSERNYGASSFLDFAEKLAAAGLVALKHAGRSVMVELNPAFTDEGTTVEAAAPIPAESEPAPTDGGTDPVATSTAPVTVIGDMAAGVATAGRMLAAATNARWPMYVRNVKQIFRTAGGFDERQYGFGGLMDLLKALQKDGFIRMERDRRGGLRVFQGQSLAKTGAAQASEVSDETGELIETGGIEPGNAAPFADSRPSVLDVEGEIIDEVQPLSIVDTTAELLGRGAGKRGSRTRATSPAPKPKRAVEKKPAAKRSARGRKKTDDS